MDLLKKKYCGNWIYWIKRIKSTECYSIEMCLKSNQECKVRPVITNINSHEPSFYPYSILVNKCSGSCNNINGPYAKLCVPDGARNINVKTFNLMSRTNETRHVSWHETCTCKCSVDASVFNDKQRWNNNK